MSILDEYELDWAQLREVLAPFIDDELKLDDAARAVFNACRDGKIDITVNEGYDSCSACGGYHSVHYNCQS